MLNGGRELGGLLNSNVATAEDKGHTDDGKPGAGTNGMHIRIAPMFHRIRAWLSTDSRGSDASQFGLIDAIEVCKRAAGMGWASTISTCFSPGGNKASAAALCIRILRAAASKGLKSSVSFDPAELRYDLDMLRRSYA